MKFIIPMVVGAVIGYFTNWLAIKMLFRPHEAKKILGIRIPFTPGLIPKERYRVSESIGKAVGEHLLTAEKIREVLGSDKTKASINNWINSSISKLQKNNKSILDIIKKLELKNHYEVLEKVKEKIVNIIIQRFKDPSFKLGILNYVENNIYEGYKEVALDNIHGKGKELLNEISSSQELKELLIEEINVKINEYQNDNRTLKELIPEATVSNIYENINNNKGDILYSLRGFFHEPKLEERLKLSIGELVNKNVSKMITMFLDSEVIADKVFQIIDKYINSEDAEEMIMFAMKNGLDKILQNPVSALVDNTMKYIDGNEIEEAVNLLIKQLGIEDNQEKIMNVLLGNIKSKDVEIKENLMSFIDVNFEKTIGSSEFKETILRIIDINIDNTLNNSISNFLRPINRDMVIKTTNFLGDIIRRFGHETLLEIINLFDVSKIVEEQINSFDVEFTEKLILDIAEKELKAITWLGALLGGIMGLLSPLLQVLV